MDETIEKTLERLRTDGAFRDRFFGEYFAGQLLDRLDRQSKRIAELEAGGANGAVAEELAQARARIAQLEEQLRDRGEEQEGEDEHRPFWAIVTTEIERLPRQTVAGLDAEADRMLRHRAGGMLSAHLRGEFTRAEFRKRLKDELAKLAQGKAVVRRTSPTPAPAVQASGAEINLAGFMQKHAPGTNP